MPKRGRPFGGGDAEMESNGAGLPEWMTRRDICEYLDIPLDTLGSYISRGYFPRPEDESRPHRWRRETVVTYAAGRSRRTKGQRRTRGEKRLPKRASDLPEEWRELFGDDPIARAAMRLREPGVGW